jgi:predicted MarR family transcription regulator
MPSFTMEELLREAGHNVDVTVTSQSNFQQMRKTKVGERVGRSVDETKALIKKCITEAGEARTVAQICTYLERGDTPHIRNILKTMVQDGELIELASLARSRTMVKFSYNLPQS